MSLEIENPRESHIEFARSMTESNFGPKTVKYLEDKYAYFKEESNRSFAQRFGRQIAHIFQMPYRIVALAIQTVADAAAVALSTLATALTLGLADRPRHELKARTYNLLVADIFTWASLPVSVLFRTAYIGANSLHLGTTRFIDKADETLSLPATLKPWTPGQPQEADVTYSVEQQPAPYTPDQLKNQQEF